MSKEEITPDAFCPECNDYIVNERVTFEECCDKCNTEIEWHEVYLCPNCKKECYETELLEDNYAQYKGFSEELFCPHCKHRVD